MYRQFMVGDEGVDAIELLHRQIYCRRGACCDRRCNKFHASASATMAKMKSAAGAPPPNGLRIEAIMEAKKPTLKKRRGERPHIRTQIRILG